MYSVFQYIQNHKKTSNKYAYYVLSKSIKYFIFHFKITLKRFHEESLFNFTFSPPLNLIQRVFHSFWIQLRYVSWFSFKIFPFYWINSNKIVIKFTSLDSCNSIYPFYYCEWSVVLLCVNMGVCIFIIRIVGFIEYKKNKS